MAMHDPHTYLIGYHLQNVGTALIHEVGWTLLTSLQRAFCLRWDQKGLKLINLESLQTEI